MFCPSFHSEAIHSRNMPINQTSVETFPGAACVGRFAVIYAPRQISRDVFGATQSGSPPVIARLDCTEALPSIRCNPDDSIGLFFRPFLNIQKASSVESVSKKITSDRDNTLRQKPSNERLIFPAIFRLNPEAIAVICSPLPGG